MTIRRVSAGPGETLVRVDAIVGRATEDGWPDLLVGARVDLLRLDQAEAQKSRLRKATDGGVEVAISLDRGTQLRDGDILRWDEARHTAIVARVDLKDVLVIDLSALLDGPREESMARCVELGHALGNQHWPAVVKGRRVYVPLAVARAVMASVMKTHSFEGVTYTFVPGAEVSPYLTPHEARRLFGGPGDITTKLRADGPARCRHEHAGRTEEYRPVDAYSPVRRLSPADRVLLVLERS